MEELPGRDVRVAFRLSSPLARPGSNWRLQGFHGEGLDGN